MNELEISQCLKGHPLTRNNFGGVFARDELHLSGAHKPNTFIIINTDVRGKRGEHWLLMFWPHEGNPPLYFDSYGLPPMYPEIEKRLLKNVNGYTYNKQRLQSDYSNVCGHYCIYFATQLCAGYSLEDIRGKFSKSNLPLNDKLVVILFRKLYGWPCVAYKKQAVQPMICQCLNGDQ